MGSDDTYAYRGLTQEVRSSPREIDDLATTMAGLGAKRVMVMCGQNVLHKSDVATRVQDALGDLFAGLFDGVRTHSPVEVAEAARDGARDAGADTLVTVGGGSAITIAKGAALLLSTDHDLTDYRIRIEPPHKVIPPSIPLPEITVRNVAVVTTMGCAELGPSGGGFASRDRSEKVIVLGRGATSPQVIVIDGDALATTPPSIQRSTAIGQLRIAVESIVATSRNPLSEALGFHAITRLHRELTQGWSQDPLYLLRVKSACLLASHAFVASGSLAVNTAIAHQIGAICDIPHGEANAILLPHTIRFNAVAGAPQLQLVADALGIDRDRSPDVVAGDIAERIAGLSAGLEIPSRLRDVGVPAEKLDAIATATMGDRGVATNPTSIYGPETIRGILDLAW